MTNVAPRRDERPAATGRPSGLAGFLRLGELLGAAGLSAVLTMAYIVYVGRTVGPEEYADFAAALSVVYFVGVALSPLTPTIGRLTARYVARGESGAVAGLRGQINARIAIVAVFVMIGGIFVAPALGRLLHFRSPASLVLSLAAVLLYAILSVDRAVAQGLLRFRLYNANTLLESIVRGVVVVVVLGFLPSAAGALISYVTALAVSEVVMALSLRIGSMKAPAEPVNWLEVRRLTMPILVLMVAIACFQNADMLVVKHFFGASESGAYGAATSLARAVGVIFVPLYVLAGPTLTHLQESKAPIFGPTLKLGAIFLALVTPPLIIFLIWPQGVVTLLYGQEFAAAGVLLAPLAGISVVTYVGLMLSQALITIGHGRFLYVYGAATVAQVVALLIYHDGFRQVLAALWTVQSIVVAVITLYFVSARTRQTTC